MSNGDAVKFYSEVVTNIDKHNKNSVSFGDIFFSTIILYLVQISSQIFKHGKPNNHFISEGSMQQRKLLIPVSENSPDKKLCYP